MASLAELMPTLDDASLKNLRANAIRLESGGKPDQQEKAAEILPLIEAEMARRVALKPPPVRRTKAKAAKTAATVETA